MARDFTALGSTGVLTFVTLATIGYLVLVGKRAVALLVAGSIVGGTLLSSLLKWSIERPRPDLVAHATYVETSSFPSGHATMSAIVYLTLGALLARVQPDRRIKTYFVALAIALTVTVGFTRIYLGVHWPSDVLAGWSIGSAWALLSWLAVLWLQQRGHMQRGGAPTEDKNSETG